jgi:ATP-grasp domain
VLDLRTEDDVRAAYHRLASQFGLRLAGVLVQPMITGGTEVIIGIADDQMFGPLVVFGLGGVATEVLADHAARLAPLTEADAGKLIDSIRSAPLLHGHHHVGRPEAQGPGGPEGPEGHGGHGGPEDALVYGASSPGGYGGRAAPPRGYGGRAAPHAQGGSGGDRSPRGSSAPRELTELTELLMRVSRLADDLPEVTELDLNPVIVGPDGVVAVDVRVKVTPQVPQDPFLRRLR